jgi:hypothetical protein
MNPQARSNASDAKTIDQSLRAESGGVCCETTSVAIATQLKAKDKASGHRLLPAYAISDSPADTIADNAATVGASYLIVGAPQRNALVNLLRGNIIRNISSILPEEIHLLVYA